MGAVDLFQGFNFKSQLSHLLFNLRLFSVVLFLKELVNFVHIVFTGSLQNPEGCIIIPDLFLLLFSQMLLFFQSVNFFVHFQLSFCLKWVEKLLVLSVLLELFPVGIHTVRNPKA